MNSKRVCVYASSSERVDHGYRDAAESLGAALADSGRTIVYGGARIGLMGALAKAAKRSGGKVVGVIPRHIADHDLAFEDADEIIVTETLRERKHEMELRSDAFLALPGGFGTMEELLEIITLKQLHRHVKAVCLLDVDSFYAPLNEVFEHLYHQRFAREEYRELYRLVPDARAAIEYLDAYHSPVFGEKWS